MKVKEKLLHIQTSACTGSDSEKHKKSRTHCDRSCNRFLNGRIHGAAYISLPEPLNIMPKDRFHLVWVPRGGFRVGFYKSVFFVKINMVAHQIYLVKSQTFGIIQHKTDQFSAETVSPVWFSNEHITDIRRVRDVGNSVLFSKGAVSCNFISRQSREDPCPAAEIICPHLLCQTFSGAPRTGVGIFRQRFPQVASNFHRLDSQAVIHKMSPYTILFISRDILNGDCVKGGRQGFQKNISRAGLHFTGKRVDFRPQISMGGIAS